MYLCTSIRHIGYSTKRLSIEKVNSTTSQFDLQSKFLALAGRGEGGGGVLVSLCFLYLLSPRTRLFAMPRHAASRTGSEVDALRVQTVAAALDPFLDDADLP
jgi:hypothetical protein